MNDSLIKSIIEYLKCKPELTDLEKDILDTAQVLSAKKIYKEVNYYD